MSKPVVLIKTLEDSPLWVDRELVLAYLTTKYLVLNPALEIRIGSMNPAMESWLDHSGIDHFAFITAWNPRSVVLPESANMKRNALLEAQLREEADQVLPGLGVGADGRWPPEPSFLATGLSPDRAIHLAKVYDQHAIVYWQRQGLPELWWVSLPLGFV
jgi:hypothetical protein